MIYEIQAKVGKVVYEENILNGNRNLSINNKNLMRVNKSKFIYETDGEKKEIFLSGNMFSGVKTTIDGEVLVLSPAMKWYEIVLALFPFIFVMIWGNVPALGKIIPIVAGAIGGAITGGFGIISIFAMKSVKNPVFKLLIGLALAAVSIGICAVIGYAIVSLLS